MTGTREKASRTGSPREGESRHLCVFLMSRPLADGWSSHPFLTPPKLSSCSHIIMPVTSAPAFR